MPATRESKAEVLSELVEKFGRCKSVAFADYRGLNVDGISQLRGKLRKKGAEMKVAKKTLIKIAATQNGIENMDSSEMTGPVAVTFSYEDPFSGIKALYEFSKTNEKIKLLGGIIDGKVVDAATVKKYAMIPSKEELLSMFMGSMTSPVGAFVRVLDAYKKEKMKEETAAAAPAPAPAPAAETPAAPEAPAAAPEAGEAPAATV